MPQLNCTPPHSPAEAVTEVLFGVPVADPYRWLENQDSPETRAWIREQTRHARVYLESIPGREKIRERIREFLAVEAYSSLQKSGNRYFFLKRLPEQEQPSIYMREGFEGDDQLLIDPSTFGRGVHTAVRPLRVSPNGRFLLYEIKEGGERSGTFALLDIESHQTLPEMLPRGFLRGFQFLPDETGFLYVHEPANSQRQTHRAAYRHVLGTDFRDDPMIFDAGQNSQIRLGLIAGPERVGFLVHRFEAETLIDFYVKPLEQEEPPDLIFARAGYQFGPVFSRDRLFALTNRHAPNLRIVELHINPGRDPEWIEVIPESDARIQQWAIVGDEIVASYIRNLRFEVLLFNFYGKRVGEIPISANKTVRIRGNPAGGDEVFLEIESFTEPIDIEAYCRATGARRPWAKRAKRFNAKEFTHVRVSFESTDGTTIPMFLAGRRDVLSGGCHPTVMTSYGGHGVAMTPQFSVLVACLMEKGCLFALPSIRGGSELGAAWHEAGKRHNRQRAYDDFLRAAEWLIETGRTKPRELAIFGGSNSGLLAGVAMTQRPQLFRAVLLMVPMLDMLRYHLFDGAHIWREEFGTAENAKDFQVLLDYSPYHRVRDGAAYPATMIVSGDADQTCNPLHARKMTARLQTANLSGLPIILDYNRFRGHSPVLPLSERIEALTDRLAFFCDQLQLPGCTEGEVSCLSS